MPDALVQRHIEDRVKRSREAADPDSAGGIVPSDPRILKHNLVGECPTRVYVFRSIGVVKNNNPAVRKEVWNRPHG